MKKKIAITLVITLILLVVGGIISTAFLSTKKEILLTAEEREVIDRFCEKYKIDVEARPLNEIIASPSIKDNLTLLHVAALNAKTWAGETPLDYAKRRGYTEIIEYLSALPKGESK
ncbi:MAG: hypothetical protein FWE67_09030 [Planctomycetaceae bacterium]|nr:hypothetical protein [Planctomycetaceae bacterium]